MNFQTTPFDPSEADQPRRTYHVNFGKWIEEGRGSRWVGLHGDKVLEFSRRYETTLRRAKSRGYDMTELTVAWIDPDDAVMAEYSGNPCRLFIA